MASTRSVIRLYLEAAQFKPTGSAFASLNACYVSTLKAEIMRILQSKGLRSLNVALQVGLVIGGFAMIGLVTFFMLKSDVGALAGRQYLYGSCYYKHIKIYNGQEEFSKGPF